MSDGRKTKKELIEELKLLRAKMKDSDTDNITGVDYADDHSPTGLTRRDVLGAWVAPVILTVPLVPRDVVAQGANGPAPILGVPTVSPTVISPTMNPTVINPTMNPTVNPTVVPTGSPTASPTAFPTVSPTMVIPVELSEFEIE
jgi:hypothetical protein